MLSSSPHVGAVIHISGAENTKFSVGCRTQKLLLAIQQRYNHRSVKFWTYIRARKDTSTEALFLPLAHTQANPERGPFLAHINVSNQSGQGAL